MKRCSKCHETKSFSLFYANKKSRDGYTSWCKSCTTSNREYYFGYNREKAIARDGGKCIKCGMTREEHKKKYGYDITVDHVNGKGYRTPSSEKDNRLENLQTLCSTCHGKKDAKRSGIRAPRPVAQIDDKGNVVRTYESIMQAQRDFGFDASVIVSVLKGKIKHHRGYFWEYLS